MRTIAQVIALTMCFKSGLKMSSSVAAMNRTFGRQRNICRSHWWKGCQGSIRRMIAKHKFWHQRPRTFCRLVNYERFIHRYIIYRYRYVFVCMYIYIYIFISIYIYTYLYRYIYIYVFFLIMYIWTDSWSCTCCWIKSHDIPLKAHSNTMNIRFLLASCS